MSVQKISLNMNGRLGLAGLIIALVFGYLTYLVLDAARERSVLRQPRAPQTIGGEAPESAKSLDSSDRSALAPDPRNATRSAPKRPDRDSLPVEDWESSDPFEYDESETPSRDRVKRAFVATIANSFPDYRLSSDEVDRATDALVTLRSTQEALRALPFDPAHSEERRVLVETIGNATSEFSAVLGMDPAEFTAQAAREGGGVDFDHESSELDQSGDSLESEFLEPRR